LLQRPSHNQPHASGHPGKDCSGGEQNNAFVTTAMNSRTFNFIENVSTPWIQKVVNGTQSPKSARYTAAQRAQLSWTATSFARRRTELATEPRNDYSKDLNRKWVQDFLSELPKSAFASDTDFVLINSLPHRF
jgi:hypothetical protein